MSDAPARLAARLGEAVRERVEFRDECTLVVSREALPAALEAARAEGFGMLTDLTAVDRYPAQPRFEVVYLLTALHPPARVRLKVRVDADDPTVPSATSLWPGASWLEREVYDLFGIVFSGHPDLRRILLPDEWEGHPLRKDYPLVEEPVQFRGHTPKVPSQIIPRVPPGQ
jgi:NADH-quinone oxidoreductase subunit C